ncbi:hypothetical protein B0H12DRAFT_106122 [Mycena haematopus]|nr:hypothetical protein B0H12DRAFT_106122 [Mycena haematopus]
MSGRRRAPLIYICSSLYPLHLAYATRRLELWWSLERPGARIHRPFSLSYFLRSTRFPLISSLYVGGTTSSSRTHRRGDLTSSPYGSGTSTSRYALGVLLARLVASCTPLPSSIIPLVFGFVFVYVPPPGSVMHSLAWRDSERTAEAAPSAVLLRADRYEGDV